MRRFLEIIRSRRMATLAGLGFSAGLPLGMITGTLLFWMASLGISLRTASAFSLVGLAYTFKWAWAPLLDRYRLPWLGRRRGWIVLFQLGLAVSLATLGVLDPRISPARVAILAAITGILSASQDIVIDAHRADLLTPEERAPGTAAYVLGYRVALLFTSTLALILANHTSWRVVYVSFAGLMVLATAATVAAEEPAGHKPLQSIREALFVPFAKLLTMRRAAVVLVFVALFKFGDGLAGVAWATFTKSYLGFSLDEIAVYNKIATFSGSALGITAGAVLVNRLGLRWSLVLFGAGQASANLLYSALALAGKSHVLLIVSVLVDNAANAMGDAAFLAYLLSLTTKSVSATQYAVLTAVSSVGRRVLGFLAGPLVEDWLGYAGFFAVTGLMIVPALVLVFFLPIAGKEEEAAAVATAPEASEGG